METRKITIVETKNQKKSVIMSAATTLAELKTDLAANGIDYDGMTFFEGISKVELKVDSSTLPHDIPYKGNITNELVFMLTNTNKKIKSGAMSRMDAYAAIKKNNLQDACLKKFGKNFTMCKTVDLIAFVEKNSTISDVAPEKPRTEKLKNTQVTSATASSNNDNIAAIVDAQARKAIEKLTDYLCDSNYLLDDEAEDIKNILGQNFSASNTVKQKNTKKEIQSSYSNEEIDEMFAGIDLN